MITTRPIVLWPGKMTPARERERPRYKTSSQNTRIELLRELEMIGAKECFIQAAYSEDQIRLDGMPRTGALPQHPGVILTYTTKDGTFQLPCDAFDSAEQNLRAIGLTLQRLRLIEETGVKTHGKQYSGFKQLPGGDAPQAKMTVEEAAAIIIGLSGRPGHADRMIRDPEYRRQVYIESAKRTHPDAGGNTDDFQRLQTAKAILDKFAA